MMSMPSHPLLITDVVITAPALGRLQRGLASAIPFPMRTQYPE
ncbi:hypothetical protein [Algiphilus sp.]|jgi:hypothetical protein|nr:hypothetical protein [Pseudomonadota bacterium]